MTDCERESGRGCRSVVSASSNQCRTGTRLHTRSKPQPLVVTGNVTWDVLAPTDRPHRVTPFLVAGGGVFQTREHFFNGTYTSSEGAFTAGGGVRALVGDRVTLGLEMRAGWEPHIRINGVVGLQLGR